MKNMKKVTVEIPGDWLERAMKVSKEGITPTVRKAVQAYALQDVYEQIRSLRGKLKFNIDLEASREDRLYDRH